MEEAAVLEYLAEVPTATQKMIAEKIGKPERTVKTLTDAGYAACKKECKKEKSHE